MTIYNENAISRYSSPREGSAVWTDPLIVQAWRDGCIENVPPRTLEYAPSATTCNMGEGMGCTECPYRKVRMKSKCSANVPIGQFADPDDKTVARLASAKLVLERSKEAGVLSALFTGGGEPTVCPELAEMIAYSAELGLWNGLYTNLIQLGAIPELSEKLMDPSKKLVFIRGSVNFYRPETAWKFATASEAHIDAQYSGLRMLCAARTKLLPLYTNLGQRPPSIQVSIICDRRNVDDLPLIAEKVASIYGENSASYHDKNDALVVRPLTKHGRAGGYTIRQHNESVINKILYEFRRADGLVGSTAGHSRQVLEFAGMNVYAGFGLDRLDSATDIDPHKMTYEKLIRTEYASRDRCWANGLFLTVSCPTGVHLCTDRNCHGEWAVGDLREQTVNQIYESGQRQLLLNRVHACNCGVAICEPTCRAVRLNSIARAIRAGELGDAEIEEIRRRAAGERPMLLS